MLLERLRIKYQKKKATEGHQNNSPVPLHPTFKAQKGGAGPPSRHQYPREGSLEICLAAVERQRSASSRVDDTVERQRDELKAHTRQLQDQLDNYTTALKLAACKARGPRQPALCPALAAVVGPDPVVAAGVYVGGMPPPSRGHFRSSSSRVAFPLPPIRPK
ncbi:hypothetical protein BJ912DRAFT_1051878 [Pholiota molesta]|nr:hypothetical protein BJ912DRAFT_1051878 [Pholiota molesta]